MVYKISDIEKSSFERRTGISYQQLVSMTSEEYEKIMESKGKKIVWPKLERVIFVKENIGDKIKSIFLN